MKKIVFILALMLFCIVVRAQHTVYCEVMEFYVAGLGSSLISVDFGNKGADELVDENGKKIKFNSLVDALMYMERRGWSVISAFSVFHNTGIVQPVPVAHYLMKKNVLDYSEKMDGIHTKKATIPQKQKKTLGDDGYFN